MSIILGLLALIAGVFMLLLTLGAIVEYGWFLLVILGAWWIGHTLGKAQARNRVR